MDDADVDHAEERVSPASSAEMSSVASGSVATGTTDEVAAEAPTAKTESRAARAVFCQVRRGFFMGFGVWGLGVCWMAIGAS